LVLFFIIIRKLEKWKHVTCFLSYQPYIINSFGLLIVAKTYFYCIISSATHSFCNLQFNQTCRARSLVQEVKQNICLAFTSLLVWNCVSGVAMQCQKCFLYFVVLWRKIVFSMGSLSLLRSPRKCLFNKVFAKFIGKFT